MRIEKRRQISYRPGLGTLSGPLTRLCEFSALVRIIFSQLAGINISRKNASGTIRHAANPEIHHPLHQPSVSVLFRRRPNEKSNNSLHEMRMLFADGGKGKSDAEGAATHDLMRLFTESFFYMMLNNLLFLLKFATQNLI